MTNEKLKLLLNGSAAVIDDEINNPKSSISKIIKCLEKEGTIFIKLNNIRDNVEAFSNLSFIILDWKIVSTQQIQLPIGVQLGAELIDPNSDVVNFLEKSIKKFFMPILIFSGENITIIEERLRRNDLLGKALDSKRLIICNKSELTGAKVKSKLGGWIKDNQSAYLFRHLDKVIRDTEHSFFNEFYDCNKEWPCFVYSSILNDAPVDVDGEFQEFLLTSFVGRMETKKIDLRQKKKCKLSKEEILKIYSSIKYINYHENPPVGSYCGDLYVKVCPNGILSKKCFALNITAPCDARNKKAIIILGESINFKKKTFTEKQEKPFLHTINQIDVLDKLDFDFRTFSHIDLIDINKININNKDYKRIGRILHPYITSLQDRFSHYIVRRGVTKTPQYPHK